MGNATFASPEAASFWRYISSSLDRLVQISQTIDPNGLHWTPPAGDTNSVAVLVVHTIGNAEENLLETLCGRPAHRDRAGEFINRFTSSADLAERWQNLRPRLAEALASLTSDDLNAQCQHPRRGPIPGREVLIVVARHAAEHLGQAELTRDLWNATR